MNLPLNNPISKITFPLLVAIIFLLAGCEKNPDGKIDATSMSPQLIFASLDKIEINIDTASSVIPIDTGITFGCTVFVLAKVSDVDGNNDIASLHYKIYTPNSNDILKQGSIRKDSSANDSAWFSDSLFFIIKRTQPGLYRFEFSARDKENWRSNAIILPLIITRKNSLPHIDSVFTQDSVFIPVNDTIAVLFSIAVSDSDGIGDISKVYFRSINSTSPDYQFPMFDDGGTTGSGDEVAGDGIFSLFIRNRSTAGYKEFRYFVKDNTGALDSLSKFVTFYQ